MFPFLLGDFMGTLALDDEAWLSRLYPDSNFDSIFGSITGKIFFSDGETHVQGVNVIARQVDDPNTTGQDESRRNAVSVVSGFLFTGNPGQSLTGTNTGGDDFGGRDPLLIGVYRLSLPSGQYTVEVDTILTGVGFEGGSSVGPLDPPIPSPGPAEFYSGVNESDTDDLQLSVDIAVSAGITRPDIDVILNGTSPRFDSFETSVAP